jgi:copper ion binding protein
MNNRTFVVPAISCDHCVHTIKKEVGELPGVKSVEADSNTKVVTIKWDDPATWDQIKATLTEINYAPQELVMP